MSDKKTVWATLNDIDVKPYIKKKGNLDYLPWSSAIGLVKPYYNPIVTVYKNELGFNYHTDGLTCWVEVSVTIEQREEFEYLPVMDYKLKSVPRDQVTSMDVNKAIKRAVVKALASHGLGIELYTGDELPSETQEEIKRKSYNTWSKANEQEKLTSKAEFMLLCEENGVSRDDIQDFLDFVNPGMKESEKFNEIVRFLRGLELLEQQIEMYKSWQIKQGGE